MLFFCRQPGHSKRLVDCSYRLKPFVQLDANHRVMLTGSAGYEVRLGHVQRQQALVKLGNQDQEASLQRTETGLLR